MQPYCFVLMPFGRRPDPAGGAPIDFDRIFHEGIEPAVASAGLHAHRDDMAATGGVVHKQIYEALLLCDYAIADLTLPNGNVFYELGVRHAARPSSTLTLTARPDNVPFDVALLRRVNYALNDHNELTEHLAAVLREAVTKELRALRRQVEAGTAFQDSPLFQLIEGWQPQPPPSLKTDLFAERVAYNETVKRRLSRARAAARRGGEERASALADVHQLRHEHSNPSTVEAGILVDLLLTFRAFEDWNAMVELAVGMPGFLGERALVQEQLAFALNRRAAGGREGDRDEALEILLALERDGRSTAETFGLIGRVHRDRWRESDDPDERQIHLANAVKAYQRGFRLDPRDPYPGINAVSLARIRAAAGGEPTAFMEDQTLPVVAYAAARLVELERPTYWMHATLMEVAVLRNAPSDAQHQLRQALQLVRELWEPRTTLQGLSDLVDAGALVPDQLEWVEQIRLRLRRAAGG